MKFVVKILDKNMISMCIESKDITIVKFCVKSFGHNSHLNRHIKIVHERQRDYNCDICDKSFGYKNDLNKHIEIGRGFNNHTNLLHEKLPTRKVHGPQDGYGTPAPRV